MSPREAHPRVLVVDDELQMAEMLADGLSDRGYEAVAEASSEGAVARLRREPFDAVVTDLRMPKIDGLELLTAARRISPDLVVIVMTAYGAIDSAIESIRQGASHYLTKPFKLEELSLFLGRALDERRVRAEAKALKAELLERGKDPELIATNKTMRAILEIVERVARSDVPVLIVGETGTGKGLIARAVHARSDRSAGPFVTVNCAALPEALLESELFGHVKGAFTGATQSRPGLVVESSGGTLFLDEIAEMSPALQAKLLDVLERRKVRAVGDSKERAVDLRVIAATHRDLAARVEAGAFREDLRYRLDVISIELPPLRHRQDDIPLFLEHFLEKALARHPSSPARHISREAAARLMEYPWPGNVRELAHLVERAALLARGAEIGLDDLPVNVRSAKGGRPPEFQGPVLPIREIQRRYAQWALAQCGGQRMRTAERLGIDLKTLAKWLSEAEGTAGEP